MRNAHEGDRDDNYPAELEQFRKLWVATLEEKSVVWDGRKAMRELKATGALKFLRLRSDWRPNELLWRVLAEVNAYKRECELLQKTGALFLPEYKEVRTSLIRMRRDLAKTIMQVHYRELRNYVDGLKKRIADDLKELRNVKRMKLKQSRSPLSVYEGLYPKHRRKRLVGRKLDLDTRVQLQMAKMFHVYLRDFKLTRMTCARLVVLTYLVAGLARENTSDGVLKTVETHRVLNVRSVHEKIARLHFVVPA